MPRNYVRKTKINSYNQDNLFKALDAVRKDGRKIREVGRSFGIPESTLRKNLILDRPQCPRLGRKSVFSPEIELELKEYILKLCTLFYGLTPKELRRLAFRYAEKKNISNNFNKNLGLAGKDWLYCFLKRHPSVRLRQPQGTSLNRIAGFCKEEVQLFYSNLEAVMQKHKFPAHRIYNQDETGITTVQKKCPKIYGPKGVKRVGAVTSAERGRNITAIFTMSASGHFPPPILVYPRTRMSPLLGRNGPIGAVYLCSKNGWSNSDIFLQWLSHFKNHVHPTENDPVLLVLDNHSSHISIEVFEFCRNNFIHMVSLPPHTSHRLQPLDLTFFGPLKNAFYRECDFHLTSSGHTKIQEYDVAELLNKSFVKAASISNAVSGFRVSGIHPFHPEKFSDKDFEPAREIVDQQILVDVDVSAIPETPDSGKRPPDTPQNNIDESTEPPAASEEIGTVNTNLYDNPIPSTSKDNSFFVFAQSITKNNPRSTEGQARPKPREKQHSEILTSTPIKVKLENAKERRIINEEKKNRKERKLVAQRLGFEDKIQKKKMKMAKKEKKPRSTKLKRKIKIEEESSDECDNRSIDYKNLCQDDEFDDIELNLGTTAIEKTTDEICNICGDIGKDRELWFRCVYCSSWSHAECSGADSAVDYICEYCKY